MNNLYRSQLQRSLVIKVAENMSVPSRNVHLKHIHSSAFVVWPNYSLDPSAFLQSV
ncbi:hypothetical protein N9C31_01745 [Gammaproteobacteria bacterium]|nr:hypothetical protein [Gammaproteobacteria bacterium]